MKICHLISSFPFAIGGMQSYCYNLAEQQSKNENIVHIYISGNSNNPLLKNRKNVHKLKPLFTLGKATFSYKLFFELLKSKYDIIHVHLPFHFGFEIALLISKIKKIPLVVTYHCDVVDYENNKLKSLIFNIYRFINIQMLTKVDHVIFTTEDTLKNINVKNSNVSIIPVGVDTHKFKPRNKSLLRKEFGIDLDSYIVLFVGNLDTHNYFKKGVPYLLKAVSIVKKNIPNVKFIFIGKLDIKVAQMIHKEVETKNLAQYIELKGTVNDVNLPKYYSLSDILILPSVSKLEAFGTVLIEALSSGIPVIGSNLPGVRTVIRNTKAGYLIRKKSTSDIAKGIYSLYKTYITLNKFARKDVLNKYSWIKISRKIDDIYLLKI